MPVLACPPREAEPIRLSASPDMPEHVSESRHFSAKWLSPDHAFGQGPQLCHSVPGEP